MKLCIIHSDVDGVSRLTARLHAAYFLVDSAFSVHQGLDLLRTTSYDLVIIHCHLPDARGDELCAQIRNRSWTMPIILLLSASCTATHRIQSLDSGADDCLDETIEFNELLAHIRALLRRPRSLLTDVLIYQDLVLHVRDQSVSIGSHQLQLTKKEYMILHYLLRNKGKIVSRIDLLEHVWIRH